MSLYLILAQSRTLPPILNKIGLVSVECGCSGTLEDHQKFKDRNI
jgi:hypothetical protein